VTYKLSYQRGDEWIECNRAAVFRQETMSDGTERLIAGVPNGSDIFPVLAGQLEAPYDLLYVLHTSRGEGAEGRYQSPSLGAAEFFALWNRFSLFFSGDGRFDLWLRSQADGTVLVWDRHNLLYAYGPLTHIEERLKTAGFSEGNPDAGFPHLHHYRPEFDQDAAEILVWLDWKFSPLQPADRQ